MTVKLSPMKTDVDHFASAVMDLYLGSFDHLDGREVQEAFDTVLRGYFAEAEERFSVSDVLRLVGQGIGQTLQPQIDDADAEAALAHLRRLIREAGQGIGQTLQPQIDDADAEAALAHLRRVQTEEFNELGRTHRRPGKHARRKT